MSTMANLSRALNPFTRIYLLTYIPMAGLTVLLYAALFGRMSGMNGMGFETYFGLVLLGLLCLHVGRISARPGVGSGNGADFPWLILWWVNVLAMAAAFCALLVLSGATVLGAIANFGDLHYLVLLLTPLAFVVSLIGNLE